jgi:hypothetical protein
VNEINQVQDVCESPKVKKAKRPNKFMTLIENQQYTMIMLQEALRANIS